MLLPAVCMISLPYVNSNWSPETAKLGVDLCDLDLWPLTLTFCMDITFDHGYNSWKFHDDTMMGTWWKRCDRRTDGRTDRQTDRQTENTICRAAWSQLKMWGKWRIATALFCHRSWTIFTIVTCYSQQQIHRDKITRAPLNIKTVFPCMRIPMLQIRRSRDCLTFNMGIPILVRLHLYIEMAPSYLFNDGSTE